MQISVCAALAVTAVMTDPLIDIAWPDRVSSKSATIHELVLNPEKIDTVFSYIWEEAKTNYLTE